MKISFNGLKMGNLFRFLGRNDNLYLVVRSYKQDPFTKDILCLTDLHHKDERNFRGTLYPRHSAPGLKVLKLG